MLPIRVLQVSRWVCASGGGGIQTYIAALARALATRSVSLRYAALMPGSSPEYASDARQGDQHVPKWLNGWRLWRWLACELDSTDLVHIHGVTDWHFIVTALACRHRDIPYVVTAHGGLFEASLSETWKRRIKSGLYLSLYPRRLLAGAAAVVASTPAEARSFQALDNAMDIRVCPPAVEAPESPTALGSAPQNLAELRVLFVGRPEPIKSLSTLFYAAALLREHRINVCLDIVGPDATREVERLKGIATDLGLDESVIWHGYLTGDAKSAVMERAHVLVLPSLSENFGFTVVEAMAIGLPAVVSDGVGLADTVRQSGAGSVFLVGDSNALAEALAEYANADVRRERGLNAYRTAQREFSFEGSGASLERVYRDVIGARYVAHVSRTDGGDRSR